jgi:hypothetical protein
MGRQAAGMTDMTGSRSSQTAPHPRLGRERKTLAAMARLYCRQQHGMQTTLCPKCSELLRYAWARLERCPYQDAKPTCARCPVHCYRPDMRAQVRAMMRFAGPRMLLRHPVLALLHLLDGLRRTPGGSPAPGSAGQRERT